MTRSRSFSLALSVAVRTAMMLGAGVALAPAGALAQVQPVSAFHVVVSAEDSLLRCGDWDKLYPIAKLQPGLVLRVDGENADWYRVGYPTGVGAFVDGEFATASGATVTLKAPTKLKAANLSGGLRGSWKPVFENPLPIGTELRLIERVTNAATNKESYLVVPPGEARAFIARSAVRRATEGEIAASVGEALPRDPAVVPEQPGEAPNNSGATPGQGTENLLAPIVDPPVSDEPEAAQPVAPGVATETGDEVPTEPEPGSLEALEAAFESVRRQPILEAELGELIAEFEKKLAEMEPTSENIGLRSRVEQRVELLRLRVDLQAQLREIAEARRSLEEEAGSLDRRADEVGRTTQYAVVGRLTTSTVYDGVRLPRMYRIQSVGGAYARTLGYVRPDAKLDIEPKVGLVVGVVGEAVLDRSLQLNIITPQRVDVLTPNAR